MTYEQELTNKVLADLEAVGAWVDASSPHPYCITPGGKCYAFDRKIFQDILDKGFIEHSPTRDFPEQYILTDAGVIKVIETENEVSETISQYEEK